MSRNKTLKDTGNVTSLPESADGPLHYDWRDGPWAGLSGLAVVPVSHTPAPVSKRVRKTRVICGQRSSGSSASVILTQSLASRLRERLGTGGSIEYNETWKRKVTPLGIVYWAHTASGRRTFGSGSTGLPVGNWATPTAHDCGHGGGRSDVSAAKHGSRCLQREARLTGWPTPRQADSQGGPEPDAPTGRKLGTVAGWGTPRVTTNNGIPSPQCTGKGSRLEDQAASWPTPDARDFRDCRSNQHGMNARPLNEVAGLTTASSTAATGSLAESVLNPAMSRWLQGYPVAWDQAAPGSNEWNLWQQKLTASDGSGGTETP
jgi:hypothetical protein